MDVVTVGGIVSAVTNPVAQWPESPTSGVAGLLTRLVPFKTTAGYWVFVPRHAQPAGSVEGAPVLQFNGMLYSTVGAVVGITGRNVTRSPRGFLFFYGGPAAVGVVSSYAPGDSIANVAHTRTSVASYTASVPDLVLSYAPGDALTGVTHTRSTTATYVAEV